MSPNQSYALTSNETRPSRTLLPALLLSLTLHATAASVFFRYWQPNPIDHSPIAMATLLEPVPPVVITPSVPRKAAHASPPIHTPDRPPALRSSSPQPPATMTAKHVEQLVMALVPPSPNSISVPTPDPISVPTPDPVRVPGPDPIPVPLPSPAPIPTPTSKPRVPVVGTATRSEVIEPQQFDVAYLNNPRPVYPTLARTLGLEGTVLVRVQVSAGGIPEQISVAKSSGAPLLDQSALKAVQTWTFVPARRGETSIPQWVEVPIRFQLKNH
jgi:protein TonB